TKFSIIINSMKSPPQSSLNPLANRELPPHSWLDYSKKIVELAVVEPINFLDFSVNILFPV
ncbi:TPA: hypothetical protein ACQVLM_002911, partial [Serratia marcescens]